jgi:hypothetical protein
VVLLPGFGFSQPWHGGGMNAKRNGSQNEKYKGHFLMSASKLPKQREQGPLLIHITG